MKRTILYIILCAALFIGCTETIIGYESIEDWDAVEGQNFQVSQKIYYTTADNQPIDIDDYIGDSKVICNLYDDGQGIIICEEPITSIGDHTFDGCSSLTSITIPDSVTKIGYKAFYKCSSLPVMDGLRYADTYLVEAADKSRTTYNIRQGTRFIGFYAFKGCSSLTSITIPNGVREIGWCAFEDCSSLTNITIPDSVTKIGHWAFEGCSSLTSITIPNSVMYIGESAFKGCSSLTRVYCKPITPPVAGSEIFYGKASGLNIYVPRASVEAYKSSWDGYADAIVGYDF